MRRRVIAASVVLGGIALAACGSAGPGVQPRQTGDTTPTTITSGTTETTEAPAPPCTAEALTSAYTAKFGNLSGTRVNVQKCLEGWATSAQTKGFDPPGFALYRAEGDHWRAVNVSIGKLCKGHGVPPEIAPALGCDE